MCEIQQFKPSGNNQLRAIGNSHVLRRGPPDPKLPAGGLEAFCRLSATPRPRHHPQKPGPSPLPAFQCLFLHRPRASEEPGQAPAEETRARNLGSPAALTGTDRSPSGLPSADRDGENGKPHLLLLTAAAQP